MVLISKCWGDMITPTVGVPVFSTLTRTNIKGELNEPSGERRVLGTSLEPMYVSKLCLRIVTAHA